MPCVMQPSWTILAVEGVASVLQAAIESIINLVAERHVPCTWAPGISQKTLISIIPCSIFRFTATCSLLILSE